MLPWQRMFPGELPIRANATILDQHDNYNLLLYKGKVITAKALNHHWITDWKPAAENFAYSPDQLKFRSYVTCIFTYHLIFVRLLFIS